MSSESSSLYSDDDNALERYMSSDDISKDEFTEDNSTDVAEESDERGDDVILEDAKEMFSGIELVHFFSSHHLVQGTYLLSKEPEHL